MKGTTITNFNDITPMLLTDYYKTVHHMAYAPALEFLTSYWTPRKSRYDGVDDVVFFGLQGLIKEHLIRRFNDLFFNVSWEEIERPLRIPESDGIGDTVGTR